MIRIVVALCLALGPGPCIAADDAARKPNIVPNIIIVLADDLGYGDLGCYGSEKIPTPHLDALAAGGLRFTDFHSSGAVCSPTRAGLMTGRYQQRCGVPGVITAKNHRHHGLGLEQITFAELLKEAGYTTALFGKWHLGYLPKFNPVHQGFDRFRGFVSGNVDYVSHIDQTGVADWWDGDRQIREPGYLTRLLTDHAVRFIEDSAKKPFLLYVAHGAPHYPYQGPGDRADRTRGGKFPTLGSREDRFAAYVEMIQELDRGVGRIVETLRRLELERNTLVFFFSDNGPARVGSSGGLRGRKGTLWEGGHRVPAIAYWPGRIAAGRTSDALAISLDLYPTVLSIAGVAVPGGHHLDGIDLWPHISKGEKIAERTLFWGHGQQRAVRKGDRKLVKRQVKKGGPTVTELYDLTGDRGETKDLSSERPKLLRELSRMLDEWEKETAPENNKLSDA